MTDANNSKKSNIESIECSAQPFDLSFHPQREHIVATGLVDGTVELHDFAQNQDDDDDDEHDTILSSIPLKQSGSTQKTSCRSILFSKNNGSQIYAGTSLGDVCVLDTERACTLSLTTPGTGCITTRLSTGTDGINALYQLSPEQGNLLVTGNEVGEISLWDERCQTNKAALSWKRHSDYISDFDQYDYTLLASSADCTLGVMDLRMATSDPSKRKEAFRQSDDMEDELLSVQVMKHGQKVVCGTQQGVMAVWSFGTWGDVSDRFPGHPASIDALLKVDEDTLLTGSSDGLVRLVQIHPDKLLGVLGDHGGYPIEKLEFNANRSFVGSVSHDSVIRLWDASVLRDDFEGSDGAKSDSDKEIAPVASKPASTTHDSDDEWDDIDGADEGHDSDDDSDDSDDEKPQSKRLKTDNERFFEDL